MIRLFYEDYYDLELNEYPYDKGHSALGEYHYIKAPGKYGNFYDPIALHQYRSLDGNWLVTADNDKRYLEQNRGDNSRGAFENVYSVLAHKEKLYAPYTLEFTLRIFELKHYCGIAFNYKTSRNYYAVGIKGSKVALYKRLEEKFEIINETEINFDDMHDYHFKIYVGDKVLVYLDNVKVIESNISLKEGLSFAYVAKSLCRYGALTLSMEDDAYSLHEKLKKLNEERLADKRNSYSPLKLIKKIDLKNFGSGRQLRIARVEDKVIFVIAQHQKRYIRDSFAHLSSLTAFDLDGNVLWQIGEPNNSFDNTMISCDLPFQIADVNGDGKLEVIYAQNFELIIADLMTGAKLVSIPTPIVHGDELVKNNPFYRLNVDAIRVADFEGLGYKGNIVIKDRYQNAWALDHNLNIMWRYHHKNTGHFPYIYDFDNDGKDEMFIGYDLVDHDGTLLSSLPMNSDHTDEIIYARLHPNHPKRLILASGNEGMNICNLDGTIYSHNEIGHAQRISVAKYNDAFEGLQICATAFWGSDGIICMYSYDGRLIKELEQPSNGNIISPVSYDGKHILCLLNSGPDGGLVDGDLDKVVLFPDDGHPTLCCEVYDIDSDGVDEIICFDQKEMWIYKANEFTPCEEYLKYPDSGFSNYRGEYLLPKE
ncbi:MAG: hypothetical protein J6R47_06285 [Acholeplasmatales bacterium]|nr:hypothetical protein [Acholeplasmatales bacterium]